ncbi:hypothetical protein GCM10010307_11650 [Streptomyces vastus]|uniref:Uncharacterized protein n=2 Tax=Streptomyces vastus TaxID=285451 RepID=A0ABP6CP17_9ACTN
MSICGSAAWARPATTDWQPRHDCHLHPLAGAWGRSPSFGKGRGWGKEALNEPTRSITQRVAFREGCLISAYRRLMHTPYAPARAAAEDPDKKPAKKPASQPPPKPKAEPQRSPKPAQPHRPIPTPGEVFPPRRKPPTPPGKPPQ